MLAFLAMPFALFVAYAKRGRELNLVDRGLISASTPLQRGIEWLAFTGIDAWNGYVNLRHVYDANLALQRERLSLETRLAALSEAQSENERLRRLLDFQSAAPQLRLITARVVAAGASPLSELVRIGRGSSDGILRGAPVMTPDGVVGTISEVTSGTADVALLVSPKSAVPAMSQRTRARSTVRGTGEGCKLEFALHTDDLEEGDLLLTAGIQLVEPSQRRAAGSFPKGVPIGRVTHVHREPNAIFNKAEVIPAVDLSRLEEVLVVLPALDETASAPSNVGTPMQLAPAPGANP